MSQNNWPKDEKRKAQLEFEQAQFELQRDHERCERACQIKQNEKFLQQNLKYQQMLDETQTVQPNDVVPAKLSKLLMTKFNGLFSDWLRVTLKS